jgi:hypothetical protein
METDRTPPDFNDLVQLEVNSPYMEQTVYMCNERSFRGTDRTINPVSVSVSVPGKKGARHRDVPGTQLCPNDHPALRRAPHNCATGHSTGSAIRYGCSGSDGGHRRANSVVADLPVYSARPCCSCDAGPLGRQSGPAVQKAGARGIRDSGSGRVNTIHEKTCAERGFWCWWFSCPISSAAAASSPW